MTRSQERNASLGWWRIKVRRNDQAARPEGFVTGCGDHELKSFLSQPGVEILPDPYNPAGLAGSLRGIANTPADLDGAFIYPADLPAASTVSFRRLFT